VTVALLTSLAVIVRFTAPPAAGLEVLPAIVNFVVSPIVTFAVLTPPVALHVSHRAVTL
jgi:hypothetical protein